jgi:hypothetical protein
VERVVLNAKSNVSTLSRLPPRIFGKSAVFYRTLDVEAILETLRRLERRISERFPDSGLLSICHELVSIAEDVQQRAKAIAAPNIALRTAVYVIILAGVVGLLIIAFAVKFQIGSAELLSVLQAIEAAANIVVLLGAALFFLISLETRLKRNRSLRDLHVFRSIAHVIDMHQLTKDPSSVLATDCATASSPQRTMSPFELTRYLDYCSEMLSLTSKLAAVYAQNLPDSVVIDAVNEIESLTTNLSQKIWQKITILDEN